MCKYVVVTENPWPWLKMIISVCKILVALEYCCNLWKEGKPGDFMTH